MSERNLYRAAVPVRERRWNDVLLPRLVVALAVVSVHAAALIGVYAADLAQASEAAVAMPQPWTCQASLAGRGWEKRIQLAGANEPR